MCYEGMALSYGAVHFENNIFFIKYLDLALLMTSSRQATIMWPTWSCEGFPASRISSHLACCQMFCCLPICCRACHHVLHSVSQATSRCLALFLSQHCSNGLLSASVTRSDCRRGGIIQRLKAPNYNFTFTAEGKYFKVQSDVFQSILNIEN